MASKLNNEILKIMNNRVDDQSSSIYIIFIHTPDNDYRINLIDNVVVKRDYISNIGDYISVKFFMGMGDFIYDIHKNKNRLMMSIIKTNGISTVKNTYKFIMQNNNGTVDSTYIKNTTRDVLNTQHLATIVGQCVDLYTSGIRAATNDGVYQQNNVEEVIANVLDTGFKSLLIEGGKPDVKLDIAKPDNDRRYDHVVIPTGIKVPDIPLYLQTSLYGVYNGGIGTYLQFTGDNYVPTMFVYPLYNVSRLGNTKLSCKIWVPLNIRLNISEYSWNKTGDVVNIVTTTGMTSSDSADASLVDKGDAFYKLDPNLMLKRNVDVKNDDVEAHRDNTINGQQIAIRDDKIMHAEYKQTDDNDYETRTKYMLSTLAYYKIPWNYSYMDIIYPGMPVEIVMENNDGKIYYLKGIVHGTIEMYVPSSKSSSGVILVLAETVSTYLKRTTSSEVS